VPASIGGASVLQVEQGAAEAVFESFRSGTIFDQITGDATTVAPEDVELDVLNGAGVAGLAGETADQLRARGFVVRDVGNAEPTDRTVVRYPEDQEAEARTVAAHVPVGVDVEQDDSVDIVTLVLGSSEQ
jgi:hypothetical protein